MFNYTVVFLVNGVVKNADVTADRIEVEDGIVSFVQHYVDKGDAVNFAISVPFLIDYSLKQ